MNTLSRRDALKWMAAGAAAMALPSLPGRLVAGDAPRKKPNVLFIAVDDLRPELGCYGHRPVLSPNIDKLASKGMLFERAYCQFPVCSPSRSSLLSGYRPTSKRFVENLSTTITTDAPGAVTLPELFKKNGYYTISNGKIFHGYDKAVGDRSWSEKPWSKVGGHTKWLDPESGKYLSKDGKRGPFFESPDLPDNAYPDGMHAEKTIEDLRRLKDIGQPFFLGCGFVRPHLPFYAPKKYWDLYKREDIEIADNLDRPKDAPESLQGSSEITNYYNQRGLEYNSPEYHRAGRHGYYACVSYTDAQVGKVLNALDELGLRENTIVILWGDHGWQLGEHNFWGKAVLMHNSMNAPLIISVPGMKGGQRCKAIVEFMDMYPTLAELAGLETPDYVEGTSFAPLLKNPDKRWKKAAFTRHANGDSVITERYTYTEFLTEDGKTERMLYDLQADPKENQNIAEKPENKKRVKKLSGMLHAGWKRARP